VLRVVFASQEGAMPAKAHSIPYVDSRISVDAIVWIEEVFMLKLRYWYIIAIVMGKED